MRLLALGAVLSLVACGSRESDLRTATAPDPSGCFVHVFERENFEGLRDFLNGPRKFATLRDMAGRVSWRNRIGSLKTGPAVTTVTLWSDEVFEGTPLRIGPDRSIARSRERMASIESLEIACAPQPRMFAARGRAARVVIDWWRSSPH